MVDLDRRIVYWNRTAQMITGWTPEQVLGRRCFDRLLCHAGRDGRELCSEETCPMHKAMVSGEPSVEPVTLLARTASGTRVPVEIGFSPVFDDAGQVVGGVQSFMDVRERYEDLLRARRMQLASCTTRLDPPGPLRYATFLSPRDPVGGDYLFAEPLPRGGCAVFLADVMGHGTGAALHTAYLHGLCSELCAWLGTPAEFLKRMNARLCDLLSRSESFATAVVVAVDAQAHTLRAAGAGGPPPVVIGRDGAACEVAAAGLPLGMVAGGAPVAREYPFGPGDVMVLCTDGLSEAVGGSDGLASVLQDLGYPHASPGLAAVYRRAVEVSGKMALPDDVALVEVRFGD